MVIQQSFIFLDKIGRKSELNIRQQGINSWDDFLNADKISGISPLRKAYYDRRIRQALQALGQEDYLYFVDKLPQKEMWRLYPEVKEGCGYLDLEIDANGTVILLGISDYYHTNFFVKGFNLERHLIEKELSKYRAIITFNGSSFDLPKLRRMGIKLKLVHIDLKPLCVNLGLVGGLKEIEKTLNLKRPTNLYGNPVDLWRSFHASGDKEYLDLLIEYNREDVENLKLVMEHVYKKMKENLGRSTDKAKRIKN
ncbi:MAG TPA: ribonuclease H-like domain-containing protein [Candidatus Nanoarchaeia archaeon]|nr:ribonuclease H-like domain-containing protein [Candidatus Nanoarchaeia archaeon]